MSDEASWISIGVFGNAEDGITESVVVHLCLALIIATTALIFQRQRVEIVVEQRAVSSVAKVWCRMQYRLSSKLVGIGQLCDKEIPQVKDRIFIVVEYENWFIIREGASSDDCAWVRLVEVLNEFLDKLFKTHSRTSDCFSDDVVRDSKSLAFPSRQAEGFTKLPEVDCYC